MTTLTDRLKGRLSGGLVARLTGGRAYGAARRLKQRLHRGRSPAPSPSQRHFSEEELLARADEFNRNAESHWRSIRTDPAGKAHALNKPLSTVQDTGPILYRLGLLMTELRLGVGHTVLDFAAGSCWLSSLLNRLRCRTISIDVSPSALETGRELFAMDPRQRVDLEPRFLAYDGHRIPLADASVDRIAVFDAFHHVPNQDEVLGEMARVLRMGGRVVMAEPGEHHSHMDQSHMEMERFGVLENDIHFDELAAKARAAGFTQVLVKPYPGPETLTFTEEQFLSFMGGRDSVYPVHAVRARLHDFLLIVLGKGDEKPDSRAPGLLRARIELPDTPGRITAEPGATLTLKVRITNFGDTLWLHEIDAVGGYVALAAHLLSGSGEMLSHSLARAGLPKDVPPGDSVEVDIDIPLPTAIGEYTLRFDLVDEFVTWFETAGSDTTDVSCRIEGTIDSRRPNRLSAAIERLHDGPLRAGHGGLLRLSLRVSNTGDTLWLRSVDGGVGTVRLAAQLVVESRVIERDHFRMHLPNDVQPGASVELSVAVPAPAHRGPFTLRFDMVDEGLCWFAERGSRTLEVAVEA